MKIQEIPKNERPREKALKYGIESITDQELLAIIIGSGVKNKSALEIADSLIKSYTNISCLSKAKTSLLKKEFGLSQISSLKLEATFELHNRLLRPQYNNLDIVLTSQDVFERYKYLKDENQEFLVLLMLNQKSKIIKEKIMYKGTSSFIELNIKEIMVELLQANTAKLYLIHNHVDSSCKPSEEDIESTLIIQEKARILGIKLIDHIIIHWNGYFSFLRNGLIRKYRK